MQAGNSKQFQPRARGSFLPYFVLALSLLITGFFSYYVWRTAEAKDLARFNTTTQELTTYVRGRPRLYIEVLRAGAGLFAISPSITPNQFHNFVERLELKEQYQGAEGIGYLARVKRDQMVSYVAVKRQEGMRDFQIWPDQQQTEFYPVVYFEPLDQHQHSVSGYDMNLDPANREAMETARDSGLPAATSRVLLNPDTGSGEEPGFLIYAPIYENDRTPTTVEERREALSGFVYSQFRAAAFIDAVMAIKKVTDVDVKFFDGEQPSNKLFYDTAGGITTDPPRLKSAATVDVAGRTWSLAFAARPIFFAAKDRNSVYHTASAGIIVSLLLFGLTRAQVKGRAVTERSAAELRASEGKVRKTLSDRERAEEALRESEERYRELVENANDIVFTLDVRGNMTFGQQSC